MVPTDGDDSLASLRPLFLSPWQTWPHMSTLLPEACKFRHLQKLMGVDKRLSPVLPSKPERSGQRWVWVERGGHSGAWHPWTWKIRPPACKCDRGQHRGGDEWTYFSGACTLPLHCEAFPPSPPTPGLV